MTGQVLLQLRKHSRKINPEWTFLTKLDGDTRGGLPSPARAVTGCPIKFVGVGKKA